MRYFWRTREFIKNPSHYLQGRIRVFHFGPQAEKIFGSRVAHDYSHQLWRHGQALTFLARLPQHYTPYVIQLITERWSVTAEMLTLAEIRDESHKLLVAAWQRAQPVRITCPSCGRPDRTLTSTGRVRLHNISVKPAREGYGKPCPMSGEVYVETMPVELSDEMDGGA